MLISATYEGLRSQTLAEFSDIESYISPVPANALREFCSYVRKKLLNEIAT